MNKILIERNRMNYVNIVTKIEIVLKLCIINKILCERQGFLANLLYV